MILAICCWICLFTLCQSKCYIEVNNERNNSTDHCIEGECFFESFSKALFHVKNDTMNTSSFVINITSSLVTLHHHILLGSDDQNINNLTIIGNGATVACNNTGNLACLKCSNVIIDGITWDHCGDPNIADSDAMYAIRFEAATNNMHVSIRACVFQYSQVCRVVIFVFLSGYVEVHDSKFLFNTVTNSSQCKSCASLDIHSRNGSVININVIGTSFFYSGALDYANANIQNAILSCVISASESNLYIENVTISGNSGLGTNISLASLDAKIKFTNVKFLNNSNGGSQILFYGLNSILQIFSSLYAYNVNGAMKLVGIVTNVTLDRLTITGNKGAFGRSILVGNDVIDQGTGILIALRNPFSSKIVISHCNVYDNIGVEKGSIVYIDSSTFVTFLMISSNFTNNLGSALYVSESTVEVIGHILFMNNLAERGAAIFIDKGSQIAIKENSVIEFSGNVALQQGGAIYIELPFGCPHNGVVFTDLSNTSNVSFNNNSAGLAGNSIYFSIPASCDVIRETFVYKFNYTQLPGLTGPPIVTSPYTVNLCSTTCNLSNDTSSVCHIPNKNMMGQSIRINGTVCDYYGNISETVQFSVECTNCDDKYRLSSNRILVHSGSFDVTFLAVGADKDIVDNNNVTLNFSSIVSNGYKQLIAAVSLELSPCHNGYTFNENLQQCKCYAHSKNIIQCHQDYAEIKYGYWFGIVKNIHTLSLCPLHYCDYNTNEETSNGYYKLSEGPNDQCSMHRIGMACGECKPGYTLTYDSPDCVNKDKCSAGMTVLVLVLTILYWIIVVALVFGLMQHKVSLGYAYGLIYYYSIIDTLLGSNLFISDGVFQLVTILSSFSKLTPQFLGKLCFVKGLSGIDQRFINYLHALAIFLLITVVVVAARYSFKIASRVSHCIIRVVCLLILLSYTSLASTSLQLLRPLHFDGIRDAFAYSSPSITYFTGRHIPYVIVALLCELFIVIGLPLLLILEPFLKKKVNFIKIKPLLDPFQECYKNQYHLFAAYYFVCRQVIISIVYASNFNSSLYYLQTACIITVMIHVWIKPYKSDTLNVLDGIILLTIVLVVNLNSFAFPKALTVTIVIILALFPLLLSCLVFAKNFFSSWKYTWNCKKVHDDEVKFKYVKTFK